MSVDSSSGAKGGLHTSLAAVKSGNGTNALVNEIQTRSKLGAKSVGKAPMIKKNAIISANDLLKASNNARLENEPVVTIG